VGLLKKLPEAFLGTPHTKGVSVLKENGYIENYPCCAFLCKRAFHNMTLAQKGAAGIIFDIGNIEHCPWLISVHEIHVGSLKFIHVYLFSRPPNLQWVESKATLEKGFQKISKLPEKFF
jgi:hypothetical protein